MPRGVKKTQEAEAASENNVTVEGETKEVESTSKFVTVEVQDKTAEEPKKSDESKKSESKKSEKPAEKKSPVKSESKETVEDQDRFYQIVRPVPIYLAKSIASPVLGISSGKCRIHAFEGPWVKVTMGVAEKGAVTGYIMRSQAIIK